MKKIVIAPDSFKESFSALEAAVAIEKGFRTVFPEAVYEKIPMADGGEGTVQSIADALGAEQRTLTVTGPLGKPVHAVYALAHTEKVAVIEMAAASGLQLVSPEARDPRLTTTYGTGELVADALEQGATRIILGIGGSATNDGGAGFAQALGLKLLDDQGANLHYGGSALKQLARIDTEDVHPKLKEATIEVACDVDNPLLGERGAAAVYGPQKGADAACIEELEAALTHFADIIEKALGKDVRHTPGSGAAGGFGAGLLGFFDSRLASGVTLILESTRFAERVAGADLVITGEGRIDHQTPFGKTPIGVAKAAKQADAPVIAIAGQLGEGHEAIFENGIDAAFSLVPGAISLEDAFSNGLHYLEGTAASIARTVSIGLRS
ncbi:glycerate kinase [Shouchella shacheensis]|uniref:glycerate kinase n=1 Tax=Shouchella shacheensis TaxID=1649580 RepID=UPI00073FDD95|nr:glycerate kinase [Shouchella shacheensis]